MHGAFFAALAGASREGGEEIWLWFGLAAAVGTTISYFVVLIGDLRSRSQAGPARDPPAQPRRPQSYGEWVIFAFRELSRADFCFIVLLLAAFDVTSVLLPVGAIGAQVYWIFALAPGARDYHV